jgi:plasminogen activator inhibitor 1 RNA-binding protein
MALDLSDDENITVVKPAEAKVEKNSEKKTVNKMQTGNAHITNKPRKELQAEEEALKQKKKYPVHRGTQAQPADVTHPGERTKIGLKKEPHVDTHKQPADEGERRGREFERRSGTGRGKEIKKGGGGGHNWGKAGEDVPAPAATPDVAGGENAAAEAPVVEEDPSLTLEEYEKQKAQKRSGEAFELKEARKVSSEIKGTVYKKDEDAGEGNYIKLGEEHDIKKKPAAFKHKEKKVFEIDYKVRDTSAPERESSFGGARRGGGDREGGGRGAPRGGGSFRSDRPARAEGGEGSSRPARGGAPTRGFAPRGRPSAGGAAAAAHAAGGRIDTADQSAFPKLGA